MKNLVDQLDCEFGLTQTHKRTIKSSKKPVSIDVLFPDSDFTFAGGIALVPLNPLGEAKLKYLQSNYDLKALEKVGVVPTGQLTEGGPMFLYGDKLTQNPYEHIRSP